MADDFHAFQSIIYEARAKILWGHSAEEMRDWLRERGVPEEHIPQAIAFCWQERKVEMRKAAIRNVTVGGLILAASITFLAIVFSDAVPGWAGRLYGIGIFGCFYGMYRIQKGASQLICGPDTDGSISDA